MNCYFVAVRMLVYAAVYHMLMIMRMFDYMRMGTAVMSVSHNMSVHMSMVYNNRICGNQRRTCQHYNKGYEIVYRQRLMQTYK